MTRKILVVTHRGRPEALQAEVTTITELERAGIEPVFDPVVTTTDHVEAVIVLGGDGTVLRAAELTWGSATPILAINLGHVGFLAEAEISNLRESVQRLVQGDYEVEARPALDVTIHPGRGRDVVRAWALNDATIEKSNRQRMIEVQLDVDDRPVTAYATDGVVIASSTGSTAHAFSAGGPVLWPDIRAALVVPLAAHALFARPLVVSDKSRVGITITSTSGADALVTMDGRRQVDLAPGARIEVMVAKHEVHLARMNLSPFADRLVRRFSLPVNGWRARDGRDSATSDRTRGASSNAGGGR